VTARLLKLNRTASALIPRFRTLSLDDPGRVERWLLCLAAAFVLIGAVTLSLGRQGGLVGSHLWAPAAWLLLMTAAHLLLTRRKPVRDPLLLPLFALLTGWGLVMLDRLAPNFLVRQAIWLALGTVALLATGLLLPNLRFLRRYRYTWLLLGLLLLAATFIVGVHPAGFGAALWLPLPFVGNVFFQPSELLKLLLVVFLASYFDERRQLLQFRRERSFRGTFPYLAPLLLMWGFCVLLLVWQRDLGTATLFFILFLALLYLATGDTRLVAAGMGLLLVAGVIGYYAFDVVALRVDTWLNPWPEAQNRAFQIVQSLYAVAAGGVIGQGVGLGFPNYIPVVHSDFVFAAIAEEYGLIGSLVLVGCFALLAQRALRIATVVSRPFQIYLAAGMAILFSTQALMIMGGVTRLLPLTGVTLPFVSYGGSSLLISSVMLGLLLFMSGSSERRPVSGRLPFRLQRLGLVYLAAFLLVGVALVYWSVGAAPAILQRDDNPRQVEALLRIRRGSILDVEREVLAHSIGPADRVQRIYPVADIGPAVGYYSVRHGTAGIEQGFDALLRGEAPDYWSQFWRETLHRPQVGRDVRLTLHASKQRAAGALLADQAGAAILLALPDRAAAVTDAAILAMVSHPSYDPNQLEAQFEALRADERAPLLNRATQGQYQPGMVVQPFILATAVEQNTILLRDEVDGTTAPLSVNGQNVTCQTPPPAEATWVDVLRHACPAPMLALAAELGVEQLQAALVGFGLTSVPDLGIATAPAPETILADLFLAAAGQDVLTVTPLQVSLALAALANEGEVPQPRLVAAVQEWDGRWQPVAPKAPFGTAVSPAVAAVILGSLPRADDRIEFATLVLSGPEGSTNGWYLGLAPASRPRYAVVVVIEGSDNIFAAQRAGRALLRTAMTVGASR
jgi:cell division protein FtsW (lipid II flippase)